MPPAVLGPSVPDVKAVVQDRFGPPRDVLRVVDVGVPRVGPGEVLIRVTAAGVNPADWHIVRGDPRVARLMGVGLRRPRSRIAGIDAAGVVEAVGPDVTTCRPGEEVVAFCTGAFAELALAEASKVAPKPGSLGFQEAAALPIAATTALRGIRDVGRVGAGARVLVVGASGGVGTYAVQVAAALGAEVTGVCSTGNVELVRSLGAAHVVDYTTDDVTAGSATYDVILDNVGDHSLADLRRVLTSRGTLVLNAGGEPGQVVGVIGRMLRGVVSDLVVRHRLRALPTRQDRRDLLDVTELVDGGRLAPVVERTYPLADTAAAVHHVEQGHARGKVVVTVP